MDRFNLIMWSLYALCANNINVIITGSEHDIVILIIQDQN